VWQNADEFIRQLANVTVLDKLLWEFKLAYTSTAYTHTAVSSIHITYTETIHQYIHIPWQAGDNL